MRNGEVPALPASFVSFVMIYQIHRYPTDLIDVISITDQHVVIRPVLPQDEQSMGDFFRELPASARYDRFMTPLREVPKDMLKWLTHVDYIDHLALLAGVQAAGPERVIAEAHYVRSRDVQTAEFAVSVATSWQGKGLATVMLGRLARHAASAGVRRLEGQTLASNGRMLRLARKVGVNIQPIPGFGGLMRLEKAFP